MIRRFPGVVFLIFLVITLAGFFWRPTLSGNISFLHRGYLAQPVLNGLPAGCSLLEMKKGQWTLIVKRDVSWLSVSEIINSVYQQHGRILQIDIKQSGDKGMVHINKMVIIAG